MACLSSILRTSTNLRSKCTECSQFRPIHSCQRLLNAAERKQKNNISACYSLLGVSADCTEDELRVAYLEKVKAYHPDRNPSTPDGNKFGLIQEAYKTVTDHRRGQAILEKLEESQVDIKGIKHTVPQHRKYLTLDGVGFGTPSKRERQYKQYRVAQATESVYEHRKMKHGSDETAVVAKDKAEARKIKISNLIDRVVDDMIRESMQKGDFDNLSGAGRPIDHSDYNPFIDLTTHNINKIMVNNGFKPEWIMLAKEIRDDMNAARENLAVMREKLGPPPYTDQNDFIWQRQCDKFKTKVQAVNLKINKYNFIVPFMDKQMVHYEVQSNIQKVLDRHKEFLPTDAQGQPLDVTKLEPLPINVNSEDVKIRWGEVWSNIKEVFQARHH